jgi:Fe-S cluster assembly protein SufD
VAAVDVLADGGASVNFISIQTVNEKATIFSRRRAWAGRDAEVRWVSCGFGGTFSSVSTSTVLEGAGARTDIKDLFFGHDRQRIDLYQEARHLAPAGHSELACRGALTDEAKAICRGLIHIGRGAGRCQGRQKADTLLLNDAAEVATMPSLQINDDDVKCGHASAVGRLDKEKLFYLMSRGLDPATATRQLVEGYFSPIIGEMKESGLEEMVSCLIGQHFQPAADAC